MSLKNLWLKRDLIISRIDNVENCILWEVIVICDCGKQVSIKVLNAEKRKSYGDEVTLLPASSIVTLYLRKQERHIERKSEQWTVASHIVVAKFQSVIDVIFLLMLQ